MTHVDVCCLPTCDLIQEIIGITVEEQTTLDELECMKLQLLQALAGAKDCPFPMNERMKNLQREKRIDYVRAVRLCLETIQDQIDQLGGGVQWTYIRSGPLGCCRHH